MVIPKCLWHSNIVVQQFNMASIDEGNRFLRQARSMSFDTPEKSERPVDSKSNVKGEMEEKPHPSAAPPKKLCTSFEKFLKKLPGDTSTMREPLPLWAGVMQLGLGGTGVVVFDKMM